jgi:hypothetical protein
MSVDKRSRKTLLTMFSTDLMLFCIPPLPSATMSKIQKVRRSVGDQFLRFTPANCYKIELILPAVNGTVSVLKSAIKAP